VRTEIEGMDLQKVACLLFFSSMVFPVLTAEAYVIKKGDTLATVSRQYQVTPEVLKGVLPDQNWDKLPLGGILDLPARHVVVAGDTLYSLAKTWGVDVASIRALNRLSVSSPLRAGVTILVPEPKEVLVPGFWPVVAKPQKVDGKRQAVSFALAGSDFVSVSDGTVVYEGEYRGIGRVILVENKEKIVFGYGSFESSVVRFGQAVTKGQILGKTSVRPTVQLVFYASFKGEPLDPFVVKR